jgi:hypothetical protein
VLKFTIPVSAVRTIVAEAKYVTAGAGERGGSGVAVQVEEAVRREVTAAVDVITRKFRESIINLGTDLAALIDGVYGVGSAEGPDSKGIPEHADPLFDMLTRAMQDIAAQEHRLVVLEKIVRKDGMIKPTTPAKKSTKK